MMSDGKLARRDFLRFSALGLGGAFALAGCAPSATPAASGPASKAQPSGGAAPSGASTPLTIRFGYTVSTSTFPLDAAVAHGLFAKRNLKLEITPYAGFEALYTATRSGALDMGTGGLASIVDLHAQGVPVKVVFGNSLLNNEILVRKDSPLQSIAELKGKRIGVFGGASGTTANMFMAVCIAYYGFDPRTDAQVQYGAAPLLAGLVQKGDADAFVSLDPITTQQLVSGNVRSIGELGTIYKEHTGIHPYSGTITVADAFAQQHPEAVKALLETWLEAVAYLKDNPEEWKRQAAALDIKSDDEVRLLMERLSPLWPTKWNAAIVQEQIDALKFVQAHAGTGFLASIPESAFTTAYAPPSAA
jgi:ABC-type nitrate/sulfonate/bicarbonate transport system substrate-binding protein